MPLALPCLRACLCPAPPFRTIYLPAAIISLTPLNRRRAAKQAAEEVVGLNNELVQRERAWAEEKLRLLATIEQAEVKTRALALTNTGAGGRVQELERELDDLRLVSAQERGEAQRLQAHAARLAADLEAANARIERMQQASQQEGGAFGSLQREHRDKTERLRELQEAASRDADALSAAERVRDELLGRLREEEDKSEEFAQTLDLIKGFTPKYYETVRVLLGEAKGADGRDVPLLDK